MLNSGSPVVCCYWLPAKLAWLFVNSHFSLCAKALVLYWCSFKAAPFAYPLSTCWHIGQWMVMTVSLRSLTSAKCLYSGGLELGLLGTRSLTSAFEGEGDLRDSCAAPICSPEALRSVSASGSWMAAPLEGIAEDWSLCLGGFTE